MNATLRYIYAAPTEALKQRFAERVAPLAPGRPDACREWTGNRNPDGYGLLYLAGQKKRIRAHRLSWLIHRGEIADGLHVLHRCDNPPCVNPAHLFLGTQADNTADMKAKGRAAWPNIVRGEQHGKAKLTEELVREIRQGQGSSTEVARQYGLASSTIRAVRSGRLWPHVLPNGGRR